MKVLAQKKIPRSHSLQFCNCCSFSTPIVVFKGENAAYKLIEAILEEYEYCKKSDEKNISTKI